MANNTKRIRPSANGDGGLPAVPKKARAETNNEKAPTVEEKEVKVTAAVSEEATLEAAEAELVASLKEQRQEPEALCTSARRLWLTATRNADLLLAQRLYKRFLKFADRRAAMAAEKDSGITVSDCDLCFVDEQKKALLLLLAQMGTEHAEAEVRAMLAKEGYAARLARGILDYPTEDALAPLSPSGADTEACPCVVTDGVLPPAALRALQSVYVPPAASYWTGHEYSVEPPSPFFSYVVPIAEAASLGPLGRLVLAVRATAERHFPNAPKANYGEVWAHNRPHGVGHQLHFDSDDEGRGGIRNPVLGSIFYLSGGVGGPSLVTNQQLNDKALATKGWLCQPRANRLVVFNGKMLHGVIPGKGVAPLTTAADANGSADEEGTSSSAEVACDRRVTLMVALWPDIKIRREKKAGSARPLPPPGSEGHEWLAEAIGASEAVAPMSEEDLASRARQPLPISRVWERADGSEWPNGAPIPHYDLVFQGF